MRTLLRRLVYIVSGRRADADLLQELAFHREMKQEALERRGVAREEARYASRRAMGNVTLAREDARGAWIAPGIESCLQDIRYALRGVRRNPGFALAIVVVLSLGTGAATAVFGLADGLMLRSLPVHEPERLVYFSRPSFSYPIYAELQARSGGIFESVTAWNLDRAYVRWNTDPEAGDVLMAAGNFFSTLGVHAHVGRTFAAGDDAIGGGQDGRVAVITHAAWLARFAGDPAVIGRTLLIDRQPFTIIGVTRPGFSGVAPGLAPEVMIPLKVLADDADLQSSTSSWLHLLARLQTGLTVERANAAVQGIWPAVLEAATSRAIPADRRTMYLGRTTTVESARAGFSRVRTQFEEPLLVLLALAGLLLAIAVASAANLLLARGAARRREFAVRLAIGAGRWRIVRQVLTEAAVWSVLGAAAGMMLAYWSAETLVAMMTTAEDRIALGGRPTLRIVSFAGALAFVTAALCGIVPALRATRISAGPALKIAGAPPLSAQGWSLGKSLVTLQVGLAVLLLFGAALFLRSLERILSESMGFDGRSLLIVSAEADAAGYTDSALPGFYSRLQQQLASIPGVQSASLSMYPPISDEDGAWTQTIGVDGAVPVRDGARPVYFNGVTPGYFATLGMTLRHGRDFDDRDGENARPVVIINESLARAFFQDRYPIGRTITIGTHESRRDIEIVGVVANAKYQHLKEPVRHIAYLPCAQLAEALAGENLVALLRTAAPPATIGARVRQEIRAIDPSVPVRIQTIDDRIRESLATERVVAALASVLALVALVLAAVALYGLMAYTVSRQTHEIGVRIALGADRRSVVRLMIRQALVLGAGGAAAGLAASLVLGGFARNLLFEIGGTDPIALAVSAGAMLALTLLAGYVPARRAGAVDPVVALRTE